MNWIPQKSSFCAGLTQKYTHISGRDTIHTHSQTQKLWKWMIKMKRVEWMRIAKEKNPNKIYKILVCSEYIHFFYSLAISHYNCKSNKHLKCCCTISPCQFGNFFFHSRFGGIREAICSRWCANINIIFWLSILVPQFQTKQKTTEKLFKCSSFNLCHMLFDW